MYVCRNTIPQLFQRHVSQHIVVRITFAAQAAKHFLSH